MILVYTPRGHDEWPDAQTYSIDNDGDLTVTTENVDGVTVHAVYKPGAWLDVMEVQPS